MDGFTDHLLKREGHCGPDQRLGAMKKTTTVSHCYGLVKLLVIRFIIMEL